MTSAKIAAVLQQGLGNNVVLVFGLVFVVAGLAFKLGVAPFHMWIPDVYHGAPTAITLFIGTASKIAALGFVFRILAQGLQSLSPDWQSMLVIMAVLSMAIGNITAIAQTNLKRMLAYSTISHMGFLLLGFTGGRHQRLYFGHVLHAHLRAHEPGLVRHDHAVVAQRF